MNKNLVIKIMEIDVLLVHEQNFHIRQLNWCKHVNIEFIAICSQGSEYLAFVSIV